jgi:hypothetical protein
MGVGLVIEAEYSMDMVVRGGVMCFTRAGVHLGFGGGEWWMDDN